MIYLFLQIAVKALSGLLALFALVAAGALFLRKARVSALARLKKGVLLALLVCAVVATDWAQKGTSRAPARTPATREMVADSPAHAGDGDDAGPCTNLCFSVIGVGADSVRLSLSWPEGFFSGGERIDVFCATNLVCPAVLLPERDTSGAGWRWCAELAAHGTNVVLDIPLPEEGGRPPAQFFKAVVRTPPEDLRDTDRDGVPDLYEWHNPGGMNPYVADGGRAVRTWVDGVATNLADALAASAPYDIIELDPGREHEVGGMGCRVPNHPVMVTAPQDYAVVRARGLAAFLLDTGTSGGTLFANLYLHLVAEGGFQAGFWVGGNLPWAGLPASADFRNVYVRMPNPGVLYYGWHFYRSSSVPCAIEGCTVNAGGADRAWGVYAHESPPIRVANCSFVNFPSAANANAAYGVGVLSSLPNHGAMAPGTPVDIARCVFDDSFTNAVPYGRAEQGGNAFRLEVADCLLPRIFTAEPPPDAETNLVAATGQLTWSGFARPGTLAAELGWGALGVCAASGDADGDGINDQDEVYVHNTDPWLADSDNDGVDDYRELFVDRTDPANPYSFVQTLVVSVTNTVTLADVTNYVAWGYAENGWETHGLTAFAGCAGSVSYTNAASSGAVYAKAYRDLNQNGVYDADWDILLVQAIPRRSLASLHFVFGDVDKDGVADHVEREEGTDPNDAKNFRLRTTLNFANADVVADVTNYVILAESLVGWTNLCAVGSFTGSAWSHAIDTTLSSGTFRALCWRDFDGDGVYDPASDVLYDPFSLTAQDGGKPKTCSIGDRDGDHVPDSAERAEGTDPKDGGSYCYNLSATFTDIFQTTNALTAEVCLGTNHWAGPFAMTTNIWTYSDHLAVSNRESLRVYFWDDANSNGVRDVWEATSTNWLNASGHTTAVTNVLKYGGFDRDGDSLPDWWEVQKGLSIDGTPADEYADPDRDGLINLHEFWAGTDPLIPDGSNTLLSVCARGIDARVESITDYGNAVQRFVDYLQNASKGIFELNQNFWAKDLDVSCVSVWNGGSEPYGIRATAVTRRHVILSHHWYYHENFVFCDTNGVVVTNKIIDSKYIDGDMRIGRLEVDLPGSFVPAKVLPSDFEGLLGSGKYVPAFCMNQMSSATILEVEDLNCVGYDSRRNIYYPLSGKTSFTNLTTSARAMVRASTENGCSSTPVFFVIDNEPVLLFAKHLGNPGMDPIWHYNWGPIISFRLMSVEKAIREWECEHAGDYQLNIIDLRQFCGVQWENVR